jgi:hypothetical protein
MVYNKIIGVIPITRAANCIPYSVARGPEKEKMPTGRLLTESELVKTRASINSFQQARAVKIRMVTITGLHIGKMILKKILK